MKRSLSLILTLLMLFTFVIPISALEGYDKELESAIKKAKTIFNITDNYDNFEYYINSYSSTLEYYLRWYDSTEKAGGLEVTIDSDGMIKGYYKYNYNAQRDENALPKVSKEEGLEKNILNQEIEEDVPFGGAPEYYKYRCSHCCICQVKTVPYFIRKLGRVCKY